MGTQPHLFVFDYAKYQCTLVPALREIIAGRPAPGILRPVIERFATRFPDAKSFRSPKSGHCKHLANQDLGCYCLRSDLGLEPDHYIFRPGHADYRPPSTDMDCGLQAGMNYWSGHEEDFVDLFNCLVGANCLFHERWLSREMYLWDIRIEDDNRLRNDPCWIWNCADFLERSKSFFLALYRRGQHLGSRVDPGGIMGWLTPEEVLSFKATLAKDLTPPPFPRVDITENYEVWYDYRIYDDLRTVETMCRLAALRGAGLAASYLLLLDQCSWATIHA